MAGWCCLCKCNGDTADHLLLLFSVVAEIWFETSSFARDCLGDSGLCYGSIGWMADLVRETIFFF